MTLFENPAYLLPGYPPGVDLVFFICLDEFLCPFAGHFGSFQILVCLIRSKGHVRAIAPGLLGKHFLVDGKSIGKGKGRVKKIKVVQKQSDRKDLE